MRIYHTSDLHDHRGIVAPLRALRADAPGLLIDCGDSLRGSQTIFYRREPIVAELDEAGYDLQAMGNREFNYLFPVVRARVALMRHPFICSNLIDLKRRPLPFERTFALDRRDDGRDWKLRFCALLVPQYSEKSPWEHLFGWRFLDPYRAAFEFGARLDDSETFVVLSHLGLRADRELARRVPRIDLILGGHSHDTLERPEMIGEVPIVHAGPFGTYVSRTELGYDAAAKRARIENFALVPLLGA